MPCLADHPSYERCASTSPRATPSYVTPRGAANGHARPSPRSPPETRLEGKDFFKQARARLSYEQFALFLDNIKQLNAGTKTREVTLERARSIFGADNPDLYASFESLLSRHLSVA